MNEPVNYAVQCAIEQARPTSQGEKERAVEIPKDRIPGLTGSGGDASQTIRFPNCKSKNFQV